jgi:hypothetical protein
MPRRRCTRRGSPAQESAVRLRADPRDGIRRGFHRRPVVAGPDLRVLAADEGGEAAPRVGSRETPASRLSPRAICSSPSGWSLCRRLCNLHGRQRSLPPQSGSIVHGVSGAGRAAGADSPAGGTLRPRRESGRTRGGDATSRILTQRSRRGSRRARGLTLTSPGTDAASRRGGSPLPRGKLLAPGGEGSSRGGSRSPGVMEGSSRGGERGTRGRRARSRCRGTIPAGGEASSRGRWRRSFGADDRSAGRRGFARGRSGCLLGEEDVCCQMKTAGET